MSSTNINFIMTPRFSKKWYHLDRFMDVTNMIKEILSEMIESSFSDTHIKLKDIETQDSDIKITLGDFNYDRSYSSYQENWYMSKPEYDLQVVVDSCVPLALNKLYMMYTIGDSLVMTKSSGFEKNTVPKELKDLHEFILLAKSRYLGKTLTRKYVQEVIEGGDILGDKTFKCRGIIFIFSSMVFHKDVDIRNIIGDADIDKAMLDDLEVIFCANMLDFSTEYIQKDYIPIVISHRHDVVTYLDSYELLSNRYHNEYRCDKEIRYAHNIWKLAVAGSFKYRRYEEDMYVKDSQTVGQ